MPPCWNTHPLPEGWSNFQTVEDTIVADGLELFRAGMSAVAPTGEEITGSAAGRSPCAERSYYELLERVSVISALEDERRKGFFPDNPEPERWRHARSNGVALHSDWESACTRAWWELVERDRVLRSWYGERQPEHLADDADRLATPSYDFRAYAFPPATLTSIGADDVVVVGVFGFPRGDGLPFVVGYAGRPTLSDARRAAEAEALQMLAFLWGETLPDKEPAPGPHAMAHLDRLLWPSHRPAIEAWLSGAHLAFFQGHGKHATGNTRFFDLTPSWLRGELFVAMASSDRAAPLAFGESPFGAHLPAALRLHPIP
jgi:hypothetical protein